MGRLPLHGAQVPPRTPGNRRRALPAPPHCQGGWRGSAGVRRRSFPQVKPQHGQQRTPRNGREHGRWVTIVAPSGGRLMGTGHHMLRLVWAVMIGQPLGSQLEPCNRQSGGVGFAVVRPRTNAQLSQALSTPMDGRERPWTAATGAQTGTHRPGLLHAASSRTPTHPGRPQVLSPVRRGPFCDSLRAPFPAVRFSAPHA